MKICSFIGCERPVGDKGARGLCGGHYQQLMKGRPLSPLQPRNVTLPWMLEHAGYDGDDCLKWPFATTNGRGLVKYGGKMGPAARVMCRLAHGDPPTPKHQAAHSCGNGHLGCINPKHLRWATDKENKSDMVAHGTAPRGEKQGAHKLSTSDVLAIRSMAGVLSHAKLARQFGVGRPAIGKIVNRERWGHI